MKKTLLGLAFATLIAAPAMANDTLVIDDGGQSILTGVVTETDGDDLTMMVGTKEIEVDIDNLEVDDKVDEFFPVGTKIQVVGTLEDDDEINATKIIIVQGNNSAVNLTTDINN